MRFMGKIEIRLANTSERKSLEELQWRASLNNEGDRSALLAHPDAIELPLSQIENELVFVAEEVDGIKGFAAILSRADGNVELDALFVEPKYWKQGICPRPGTPPESFGQRNSSAGFSVSRTSGKPT